MFMTYILRKILLAAIMRTLFWEVSLTEHNGNYFLDMKRIALLTVISLDHRCPVLSTTHTDIGSSVHITRAERACPPYLLSQPLRDFF